MVKGKKKKGGETPDHVPEQSEEPLPPAREKSDEEFLEKYTGENSQAIWFRNIIRAQSKHVMQETIAQEIQKATSDIQLQLKQALDMIEDLKSENQKRKKQIERTEFMPHKKDEKIKELLVKIDKIEQGQNNSSIQIVGLPESEDDTKALIKLSKNKLGVNLKVTDIGQVTRLGKQQKTEKLRNVVVEFKNESARNEVYKQRKKLITCKDPKRNIYLNDKLTDHRQNMLYSARKLVKSHKIFAAWSQAGNVLVRKTENAKITQVHNHEDLRNIVHEETVSNRTSDSASSTLTHLSDYSFQYDSDI